MNGRDMNRHQLKVGGRVEENMHVLHLWREYRHSRGPHYVRQIFSDLVITIMINNITSDVIAHALVENNRKFDTLTYKLCNVSTTSPS
jgi:hypothetical protein